MREASQMLKRFGLHLLAMDRFQRGMKELKRIYVLKPLFRKHRNLKIWHERTREQQSKTFQTSKTWKTEAFFQFTSSFFDLFWFESHNRSYQQRFHLSFMSLKCAKSFHLISDAILNSSDFSRKKLVIVVVQKKFAYQFLVSCKNDWVLKFY